MPNRSAARCTVTGCNIVRFNRPRCNKKEKKNEQNCYRTDHDQDGQECVCVTSSAPATMPHGPCDLLQFNWNWMKQNAKWKLRPHRKKQSIPYFTFNDQIECRRNRKSIIILSMDSIGSRMSAGIYANDFFIIPFVSCFFFFFFAYRNLRSVQITRYENRLVKNTTTAANTFANFTNSLWRKPHTHTDDEQYEEGNLKFRMMPENYIKIKEEMKFHSISLQRFSLFSRNFLATSDKEMFVVFFVVVVCFLWCVSA